MLINPSQLFTQEISYTFLSARELNLESPGNLIQSGIIFQEHV